MSRRRRPARLRVYESLLCERFQPPIRRRNSYQPDDSPAEVRRRVRELREAVGGDEEG
jgi:hypothetical protein